MSGFLSAPGLRIILGILFAGSLFSGCRTYGGHGSEEATYQQILKAHQIFQEDFARKQAELSRLEQAAGEGEVFGTLAAQYAQVVSGHEVVLSDTAHDIAGLSEDSGYRELHRTLGAIISRQNTIKIQYERLLSNAFEAQTPADTTIQVQRPYSLIPPYYRRVEAGQRNLSVNDVLARVRAGAGLELDRGDMDMSTGEPSPDEENGEASDAAIGTAPDEEGEASDNENGGALD